MNRDRKGDVIAGRFEIESRAGQGGMGTVFCALDRSSGRRVALKLLHAHEARFHEDKRFLREAELLAELQHAAIVSYVAYGQTAEGQPFLAMEWLTGCDLQQRLKQGPLRLDESVTLLRSAAEALSVAHRRGVVHRDIKPSNIFLRNGEVALATLLDFGVARLTTAAEQLTRTEMILGTPGYMAPEQARGERDVRPAADVFSLGCVLYECLTGRPPFVADHVMAVLAKVLFEAPPPVADARPSTPAALVKLLNRMLAKEAAQRPLDAASLRNELEALGPLLDEADIAPAPRPQARRDEAISEVIPQLICVVVASPDGAQPGEQPTLDAAENERELARRAELRASLSQTGVKVDWLANGSLVAAVERAASAIDQAALAARCALLIEERWPEARVAIATGRGVLNMHLPVGEAIDRAVSLLGRQLGAKPAGAPSAEASSTGRVWLDELSARLLEPRFVLAAGENGVVLRGERGSRDETRLLLGRSTPCVGREQELAILEATLEGCIENAQASAVLITAPPGTGKSRLRHELLRRLAARREDISVLMGLGSQLSAVSPLGLLNQALREHCDIQPGAPAAAQRESIRLRVAARTPAAEVERVSAFLCELCGVAFPDDGNALLRAARSEPRIMNEQIQRAFVDFLGAECGRRPCLLVLEDLHWGDPLTVKLIDAALIALREQPLLVLALARPEISDLFPRLWEGRPVRQMALPGLSKKASARLVTTVLGDDAPAEVVARIVVHAAGNGLFLEELIRAAAEGHHDRQPETVLAMLQARLSCLEPGARRTLCAASIFGQTFWRGGVLALLGQSVSPEEADRWLEALLRSESIERRRASRFPDDVEYSFRHALVRDAAYDLLMAPHREIGH
ncbi:MAG TPA: protein kinase, partial [Polyangiaceae bacterium]|nr:protein kinase [Polyangiaceae bacterium]